MFHHLLQIWFHWVEVWGYLGVFFLMALESSVVPVPSEIVIPPAAFWASQGAKSTMSFSGVILAGTLGSYFGSVINYAVFRIVGFPVAQKYGRYFFLSPANLQLGRTWIERFGAPGVFAARLLPVVRHLVSIPAGILKMPFAAFSAATIVGAGLWCAVLAWFGKEVLGSQPALLDSPEEMIAMVKAKLSWFVIGVLILVGLYVLVTLQRKRANPSQRS